MTDTRKMTLWFGCALLLVGLLFARWLAPPRPKPPAQPMAAATTTTAKTAPALEPLTPSAAAPVEHEPAEAEAPAKPPVPAAEAEGTFERLEVPKPGTRAQHRLWARATYGTREDQLGYDRLLGGGEMFPPLGFVPTRDGKLLVLDSNKFRLVWYGPTGKLERIQPFTGLEAPVDVAVAADGTIAIVDLAGVQTKGMILLNPDGTKKTDMAQIQTGDLHGLYAVGNDFYYDNLLESAKAGNSAGVVDTRTPGIYQQDDEIIPGMVAPDGRTVLNLGVDDDETYSKTGYFWVSAVRGEEPEHLFTRHFHWSIRGDFATRFVQADAAGRIYVVIYDGGTDVLLCLDPQGNPVGTATFAASGNGHEDGTQLRDFNIVESGGLVAIKQEGEKAVHYDWYDCH